MLTAQTASSWGPPLLAVAAISLLSLVGSLSLLVRRERLRALLPLAVSLAVGAMLGSVFLHLVPELAHDGFSPGTGATILAGLFVFFLLERYLHSHDHGHDHHARIAPYAWLNLGGDALHNFADGMIVATAWSAGPQVGWPATIAVALHEIPQELGDIGVLIHGGMSPLRAVLFNLGTALLAMLGAIVALLLQGRIEGFHETLLALTAGGFIYIAAADLIPELHRERGAAATVAQVTLLAAGVAMMALLATSGHAH